MAKTAWTLGELSATLAAIHSVVASKSTAFQARLKNFNRLGLPSKLKLEKGKTARYRVGDIVEMALAVEMTQLGLSPERVVGLIGANWFPIVMAVKNSVAALLESDHPKSNFLVFDPSVLRPLMGPWPSREGRPGYHPDEADHTFLHAGEGLLLKYLARWTSGPTNRMAMINVTGMLNTLAFGPYEAVAPASDARAQFLDDLNTWAIAEAQPYIEDKDAIRYGLWFTFTVSEVDGFDPANLEQLTDFFALETGFARQVVRSSLVAFAAGIDPSDWETADVDPQA